MNSQFEYQESLNSLRFTDEQKEAIARRAAEAARQQTRQARPAHRRPVRRMALVAAAAVLVLAMGTAGATGILRSAVEVFSPLFGGAHAQTEIIDKIGYPVGASDTDNGVTVTADAVMGDAYNAVIVYTISRDDGTALLPEGTSGDMLLVRGNGTDLNVLGGSHGGSRFVEEDPAAFVAAAGGRIRLTAAMRQRYQDHLEDSRRDAEAKERAKCALARLRVLANF